MGKRQLEMEGMTAREVADDDDDDDDDDDGDVGDGNDGGDDRQKGCSVALIITESVKKKA